MILIFEGGGQVVRLRASLPSTCEIQSSKIGDKWFSVKEFIEYSGVSSEKAEKQELVLSEHLKSIYKDYWIKEMVGMGFSFVKEDEVLVS
jgi:hypothetical protein